MTAQHVSKLIGDLRGQLAASARLRLGVLAIGAILWVYGLLLTSEYVADRQKQLATLTEQAARLESVARERQWPARADEASRQLTALRAMVWTESDLGLAEAAFQDWVRATANRSGLRLRELTMTRPAAVTTAVARDASAGKGAGAGPQMVKARLVAESNPMALMGFLAEAGNNGRAVMIDRLLVRTSSQPPTTEIDLHILAQSGTAATR